MRVGQVVLRCELKNYPDDLSNRSDQLSPGSQPALWQAIKHLLPTKIRQRKRRQSIRAIINGILYVVKGGISWRLMPNDLPDWRLVYRTGL